MKYVALILQIEGVSCVWHKLMWLCRCDNIMSSVCVCVSAS